MPITKQGQLTPHSIDLQAIFGDFGKVALILTVAAIALPVLYFALLYVLAR
jgi:hypothetical protein